MLRRSKAVLGVCLGGTLLVLLGCATIMQGTAQQVSISSVPTGATVTVDTTSYGVTPVTVRLSRKDRHTIKIHLDGYEPYELTTVQEAENRWRSTYFINSLWTISREVAA